MGKLWLRIKKRYDMTRKNWKSDCRFSVQLAWMRLICDFSKRLHLTKIGQKMETRKNNWIRHYLYDVLKDVIAKYSEDTYRGEYQENAPIWICWWSGEETAPAIVKQCIKSIRQGAGSHPVYMITEENYSEYLDIPDYIINKVKSGDMCIANFSDYLRTSLVEKHGGLWLDTTIYCTQQIPEAYFEQGIFTGKGPCEPNGYLSNGRWTSFCLGGLKGHVFFRFFKEALEVYWEKHACSIDYLLVDYLIETAYLKLQQVRTDLDNLSLNNIHRDDLQAAMNKALPAKQFDTTIKDDTVLYKLSWREQYSERTDNGEDSIYKYFLSL